MRACVKRVEYFLSTVSGISWALVPVAVLRIHMLAVLEWPSDVGICWRWADERAAFMPACCVPWGLHTLKVLLRINTFTDN